MATDERRPFSIADRAGDDLEAQVRLAGWVMGVAREAQADADALCAPIEAEIERLSRRALQIRRQAERRVGWAENQLALWVEQCDVRERLGKSVPTAHGVLKTRQTKGKTAINEDAVYWLMANRDDCDGLVRTRQEVDPNAVRERFEPMPGGRVLDRNTGELMELDVVHYTEPPAVKVALELDEGIARFDAETADEWEDVLDGLADALANDEGEGDGA